jgi:hypothetical protein
MASTRSRPDPEVLFERAKRDVRRFKEDVEAEPWKVLHEQAMRCYAFQDLLKVGVNLFESFVALDEALRLVLSKKAKRTPEETTGLLEKMRFLFTWWIEPCARFERELVKLEKDFGEIEHAADFRRCYEEAKWMLADAKDALKHPKMVEARDAAIDALRSGNVD